MMTEATMSFQGQFPGRVARWRPDPAARLADRVPHLLIGAVTHANLDGVEEGNQVTQHVAAEGEGEYGSIGHDQNPLVASVTGDGTSSRNPALTNLQSIFSVGVMPISNGAECAMVDSLIQANGAPLLAVGSGVTGQGAEPTTTQNQIQPVNTMTAEQIRHAQRARDWQMAVSEWQASHGAARAYWRARVLIEVQHERERIKAYTAWLKANAPAQRKAA